MTQLYNLPSVQRNRRQLRIQMTSAERALWKGLRNKQLEGLRFLRQYSVGPYILDFYCPSKHLAIEADGGHHDEKLEQAHDEQRTTYLKRCDIQVLRFWNNEILSNINGVVEKIREVVVNR